MDQGYQWLETIAAQMKDAIENGAAPTPEQLTVRELLNKFGSHKLGDQITSSIRNGLEKYGLIINQDFEDGCIDSPITITLDSDASEPTKPHYISDLTHHIRSLKAANKRPMRVKPDNLLKVATTIMQINNYSQLPVMTSERDVKGVITWKSIGARLSLGRECEQVRQCMDPAIELPSNTPLFEAIAPIAEHGYVLVRGEDKVITGIITAADISFQFMQLAGPFLVIGGIERHLRHLIRNKFTLEQLRKASDSKNKCHIKGPNNLTLGGYCRLLENEGNWERLNLNIERTEFINHLHEVRDIRNSVMHFNPDGLSEDETRKLRDIARFFENLVRFGAM